MLIMLFNDIQIKMVSNTIILLTTGLIKQKYEALYILYIMLTFWIDLLQLMFPN